MEAKQHVLQLKDDAIAKAEQLAPPRRRYEERKVASAPPLRLRGAPHACACATATSHEARVAHMSSTSITSQLAVSIT